MFQLRFIASEVDIPVVPETSVYRVSAAGGAEDVQVVKTGPRGPESTEHCFWRPQAQRALDRTLCLGEFSVGAASAVHRRSGGHSSTDTKTGPPCLRGFRR